jgi:hypothetical protein
LLLGSLALLAFVQERREPAQDTRERLHRACAFTAAAVACILCGSKVLSPQFLLWLLPAVALLPGRRGVRVWQLALAAAVLTQLYYPYLHEALVAAHPLPLVLAMLRNAALIATAITATHAAVTSPSTAMARQAPAAETATS